MAGPELAIRITGDPKEWQKALDQVERSTDVASRRIARTAAVGFAAATAGAGLAIKAFNDYETALVATARTTELAGKEMAQFEKEIRAMSESLGRPRTELLGIAEAAGTLGIRGVENLTKFTRTMAMFDVASATLKGEEAATSIARIISLTGGGADNVDRFASEIAHLADAFNATEREIVSVSEEISRINAKFPLSTQATLALSAAFASFGISPEIARTGLSQFASKLDSALREGGEDLRIFMALTGMTREELERTFRDAPEKIFEAFSKGLGATGNDASAVLAKLGLDQDRLAGLFLASAQNADILTDALGQGNKAFDENTKLVDETNKALDTNAERLNRAKETFVNAAADIGQEFTPVVEDTAEALRELAPIMRDIVVPAVRFLITEVKGLAMVLQGIVDTVNRMRGVRDNQDLRDMINQEHFQEGSLTDIPEDTAIAAEERLAEFREVYQDHQDQMLEMKTATKEAEKDAGVPPDLATATDEEFDKLLGTHEDRLQKIQEQRKGFADKDLETALYVLKNKSKFTDQEIALAEKVTQEKTIQNSLQVASEFAKLGQLVAGNSKAASAFAIVAKAANIAQSIMSIQTGVAKAQELPFPANLAETARILALGASIVATIRGTSTDVPMPSFAIGVDRVPRDMVAHIHRDEMIVPAGKAEEMRQGGAAGSVSVQIDITDRAAEFITAGQRQNNKLGVSR